jgi:hypothetical protein
MAGKKGRSGRPKGSPDRERGLNDRANQRLLAAAEVRRRRRGDADDAEEDDDVKAVIDGTADEDLNRKVRKLRTSERAQAQHPKVRDALLERASKIGSPERPRKKRRLNIVWWKRPKTEEPEE